ncbi:MAG: YceI family protein [Thermodesulfobacteriota bacterium]
MTPRTEDWTMKKLVIGVFLLSLLMAAPALAADTYTLDPVHSTTVFRIRHLGVSWFQGRFNSLTGTIVFDEKNSQNSKVNLKVAADSIDTFNKQRDDDLKSPNFFNVKKFPEITFVSDKISKKGEGDYEVSGKLTLMGVTKPVKVDARLTGMGNDPWGGQRVGFVTSFSILRSEFGMTYDLPTLVGNDVILTIGAEGVKEKKQGGK